MTSMPVVLWGHIACAIFLSAKGKCNSITMWNTGNNNYLSFDKRRGIYSHPRRKFGQVVKGTIWLESFHKCPTSKHVGGGGGEENKKRDQKYNYCYWRIRGHIYKARKRTIYNCELFFQNSSHVSGMYVSLRLSGFVCLYVWCRGQ